MTHSPSKGVVVYIRFSAKLVCAFIPSVRRAARGLATRSTSSRSSLGGPGLVRGDSLFRSERRRLSPEADLTCGNVAVLCASLSTFSQLLSVTGAAGVISFIIQDIPKGRENATWIISGITLVQASACPLVVSVEGLTSSCPLACVVRSWDHGLTR